MIPDKKAFIVLIALISYIGQALATELNLIADNSVMEVGDSVTIKVGLYEAPATHGGGLNLEYNQKVLRVTSVQVDPVWNFSSNNGVINNDSGRISNIIFTNFNGLTGDIPVATVKLVAVGEGPTGLHVSTSSQNPLAGSEGKLQVTVNNHLAALNVSSGEKAADAPAEADESVSLVADVLPVADETHGPLEDYSVINETTAVTQIESIKSESLLEPDSTVVSSNDNTVNASTETSVVESGEEAGNLNSSSAIVAINAAATLTNEKLSSEKARLPADLYRNSTGVSEAEEVVIINTSEINAAMSVLAVNTIYSSNAMSELNTVSDDSENQARRGVDIYANGKSMEDGMAVSGAGKKTQTWSEIEMMLVVMLGVILMISGVVIYGIRTTR